MDFKPQLILGIGNSDAKYENTYHNVGILLVSDIIERHNASLVFTGKKMKLYKVGSKFLATSSCFMNVSGEAIAEALKFKKIPPEELLVAQDDSDLPLGTFRFSFERGSAGHKGIDSIFKVIGGRNFWRVRIGIRPLRNGKPSTQKAGGFVLKKISPAHKKVLQKAFVEVETIVKLKENDAEPSG